MDRSAGLSNSLTNPILGALLFSFSRSDDRTTYLTPGPGFTTRDPLGRIHLNSLARALGLYRNILVIRQVSDFSLRNLRILAWTQENTTGSLGPMLGGV